MKYIPVTALELQTPNPFLELVKQYIRLIDRSDRLTYGHGLKVLYGMKAGLVSFDSKDCEDLVAKADAANLIPRNLDTFLQKQIMCNIALYAQMLGEMIEQRIIGIGNGDIRNPPARVINSPQAARRAYYLPPNTLIKRISDALMWWDCPSDMQQLNAATIPDVCQDALLVLMNMEGRAGHITPDASAYGTLVKVVEQLIGVPRRTSEDSYSIKGYKESALPALQILWVLAKLLHGDLTPYSERGNINEVDLSHTRSIDDGTLAAIPFPNAQVIGMFQEYDTGCGISMKARFYLNAASKVALNGAAIGV